MYQLQVTLAYRLSAITSAYTVNSHFAAGEMYVGNTPGFYTTGLHNWGQVLDTQEDIGFLLVIPIVVVLWTTQM